MPCNFKDLIIYRPDTKPLEIVRVLRGKPRTNGNVDYAVTAMVILRCTQQLLHRLKRSTKSRP